MGRYMVRTVRPTPRPEKLLALADCRDRGKKNLVVRVQGVLEGASHEPPVCDVKDFLLSCVVIACLT
jgi:hypothetical protein